MVVHTKIDKEEEISKKIINVFNDNEMWTKHVSFKWRSSKIITNATIMNYYDKDHLLYEVLTGISAHDTIE